MGLMDGVIKFSIKKNLTKWLAGAGTALVSVAVPYIAKFTGVELTVEQQAALSITIGSAIVGLANIAKKKLPPEYASYIP